MTAGTPWDWGKQTLHPWRVPKTQGRSSDFLEGWAMPTCLSAGSPEDVAGGWRGGGGDCGSFWGKDTGAEVSGSTHQHELSWIPALWHQDLIPPTSCRRSDTMPQTKQPAGREPNPTRQQTGLKTLDAPFDRTLPTRAPRPSSTHKWASTSTLLPGHPNKPLDSLMH